MCYNRGTKGEREVKTVFKKGDRIQIVDTTAIYQSESPTVEKGGNGIVIGCKTVKGNRYTEVLLYPCDMLFSLEAPKTILIFQSGIEKI